MRRIEVEEGSEEPRREEDLQWEGRESLDPMLRGCQRILMKLQIDLRLLDTSVSDVERKVIGSKIVRRTTIENGMTSLG